MPTSKRKTSVSGGARRATRKRRGPSARAIEATLAGLAHDIRTPLAGILSLGELLATSGLGERERGWALAIKDTAAHLAALTTLIVDAARADAAGLVLRRQPFRPRELLRSVAALLTARAEAKGVAAEISIADTLPALLRGDRVRLRAALENLVDNALKFTEHGRIALSAAAEKAPRGRVRLVVSVTDSGIGLKPAEIRRLFRPFVQADENIARRYGGAGLGLALVKRSAEAMGGDLTVTSGPGAGSTFRFTAIVEKAAEAGDEGEERPGAPPSSGRSLRILCAEDNPYARVVLNTIVTELGHRADFVATGESAVDAVAGGGYDLVLMDVTLPGIDGMEAARRIRALPAPAQLMGIVGVSGGSGASAARNARDAGMNAYLVKPFTPTALARAIATSLRAAGRAPP
jgi:CheY-like chemotaxis protein/nitrogen-specific signal transduction histidine kinase